MRTKSITSFAVLALAPLALLLACSSPPEPTSYLMRDAQGKPATAVRPATAPRVGLGRIIIAPYLLSSRGLVIETAPGEVRPAQLHQWAEPFNEGVRWFLRGELERALGYPVSTGIDARELDYTISVSVSQLHGTLAGEALLESSFAIRSGTASEPVTESRFAGTQPIGDGDYAALARAEQELLSGLADAIAAAIRAQAP